MSGFRIFAVLVIALLIAITTAPIHGESPATKPVASQDEIVLGMSTVLSGPAADLGLNMRAGVEAALNEANRAGGIKGKKLRLIALDDGYEPTKTVPNMHKLVSDENVLAIIGNVGTPTAVAAIPIAMEAHVPFYGAFTGAGVLRKSPPDRYVINYRASYSEETAAMVDALVEKAQLKPDEIAFFTQRDAYGDAGFAGGLAALKRHGLKDEFAVAHVRYERNTVAVEKALSGLLLGSTQPKAVIMVGAYAPCATFIKLARQSEFNPLFLNVSFVGSEPLAKALSSDGEGVIVTQTVPHFESDLPMARQYRAALRAFDPQLPETFGSMEGYVSTRLLLLALAKQTSPFITRESIVESMESLGKVQIGLGADLELSKTEHQACHDIWPTVIRGGKVIRLRWDELAPATAAPTGTQEQEGPAHADSRGN
ncbi:MAG TPA: ABC transporter substrate-binding protein [Tepidisphaeraceae bacterium]|jgi:ABC-type branched-subunit amino acid transport system substrate-binding protein